MPLNNVDTLSEHDPETLEYVTEVVLVAIAALNLVQLLSDEPVVAKPTCAKPMKPKRIAKLKVEP